MIFVRRLLLSLLIVVLAACNAGVTVSPTPANTPTPAASPTPVTRNQDWTSVGKTINGVTMVEVPSGCFSMGASDGRRDERPVNQVCFSKPFWIDQLKVTNAQYGSEGHFTGANRPRENLTWFEAHDFCAKRGARLPTEAEWEYAARGPDNLIFPWGNTLVADNLIFDRNMTHVKEDYETADVGSRPSGASWVGAMDMSGDGWEWVHSLYKPYPYNANDGRESDTDTTNYRAYRSGWLSYQDHGVSTSIRFYKNPSERDWHLSFRCAADS